MRGKLLVVLMALMAPSMAISDGSGDLARATFAVN